jgi:hypothetical protein
MMFAVIPIAAIGMKESHDGDQDRQDRDDRAQRRK